MTNAILAAPAVLAVSIRTPPGEWPVAAVLAGGADGVGWLAVGPQGRGTAFSWGAGGGEWRAPGPGWERLFRHDRKDESPAEPLTTIAPGEALELTVWFGEQPSGPD